MFKTVAVLSLCASIAGAQGSLSRPSYPDRNNFLVIGDALGTAAGGLLGGTTLLQAMRVSGVVRIRGDHAIDVTATRLQTFLPPSGSANDYEYGNPEGDALVLSYASLGRSRAHGFPAELSIGGGVIRRNTSEAGRTRDTWVGRLGYDSDPFSRWSHADAGVGFHAFFMPTNTRSLLYVATLGLYFRIG
jgi:hypothetical protein